jgi:hypothetical protein
MQYHKLLNRIKQNKSKTPRFIEAGRLSDSLCYMPKAFTNIAPEKKRQSFRSEKPIKLKKTKKNCPVALNMCKWK